VDLKLILRALESRNYRLFFAGQLISLIGTWLTRVATGWLVYRLTHSALLLGVVGFAGQIPTFLAAPVAGVLADRWNRHRVLVVTQVLSMLQSLAMAYFALRGTITVHHVLVLAIIQGLVNAMDMPARQAFVVEMVEKREHLGNAIALNSTLVNGARLLGPAVGGVLIAAVDEGWCFLIDGLSYIAVVMALLAMRVNPRMAERRQSRVMQELSEGFRYAFGFRPIRSILILMALVSLAGVPYTALMPIFAEDVLHGGPKLLGFLMAASGIGALAGAVYLAARRSVVGLGRVIVWSAAAFGAGLVVFALSRNVALSMAMMLVTGLSMILEMASSNTVLQVIVEDEMRGRVMSFFLMSFMGMVPVGTLISGWLADRLDVTRTVMIGGAICIGGALWFARELPELRRLVRPIYVKRGIMPPEVAAGLQTASEMTAHEE
jgi:MFS family permease